MAKKTPKDRFTNIAYAAVTESLANTLTFSEINTGVSVHQKIAWVISRIDFLPDIATLALIGVADDAFDVGLALNNKVDDLADLSDPAIVAMLRFAIKIYGTAGNAELLPTPIIRDFSDLPGGGLILTPKPLYIAAKGTSLASPGTATIRIYYTVLELAADEFWELVQASRIVQ